MKRATLSIVLAMLLIIISGGWFVLNSQWGLERAYELVRHSIPGKLSIDSLQGKLLGPISLAGVSYADDGIDVKLDRLELDWQPARLFMAVVRITKLDADGLTVQLTETSIQSKPEPSTGFVLPFNIDVLDARLSRARIVTAQQQSFLIRQVIVQAKARDNSVQLAQLSIETESFDLRTEGKVGLDDNHPVALHTIWAARFPDVTTLKGSGTFTGSLKHLALEQTITQPGLDVTLHGSLINIISHLGWNLTLDIRQLSARQLVPSWPRLSTQGKLKSDGQLQAFTLSGTLVNGLPEQGSLQSSFELNATPDVWRLTSFNASHNPTNGTLYANGEWRPGSELGTLTLAGGWHQLVLPLSPGSKTHQYHSETGSFAINGGINNYDFRANADLAGQQLPSMQLTLNGRGDKKQVTISQLSALTLDGEVTGSALASWDPGIHWEATLFARDINPAKKWHDWPGRLNAELHAYRKGANDGLIEVLDLKTLTGKLRGFPVNSHGTVTWSNKKINVNNVDFNIGDSRFWMSGIRNKDWKLQAELSAPDLNTLWPHSKGRLDLRVSVTGPRLTPHIIANINGEKLAFEDYRIGKLAGDLDIDLQSDERFITMLTATEIAKSDRQWQSATIKADGARSQHRLQLELKHEPEFIRLIAHAGLNAQQVWSGDITQTTFNLTELGEWQQTSPAPFHLAIKQASLGPWCLTQPGADFCLRGEHKQNIWNASLDAKNLPLALAENRLPPHLRVDGKTDIDTSLHYIPGHELTGDLLINAPDGFSLKVADKQQTLRFGPGKIQASLNATGLDANISLSADDFGELALEFNLPNWNALSGLQPTQALTGHFTTSLTSLSNLNGFILDSPDLTGSINANLSLGGTIGAPLIIGETTISQASADIPALGIKLEDINLHAHSKTGSQLDYRLSARSGKAEPLTITGYTLLQKPDGWPTKLNIRGDDFELANLPDIKVNISPQLDIGVQGRRIDLNGDITVPYAIFRPRALPKTSVSSSQDVIIIDESELPVIEERWKIYSHVRVVLGEHVNFDGFGLRGEVSGDLLLTDEPGKLTVGQGEIKITEGTYKAYGQDAKIRHGRLMFANTVVDNPAIDLEAVREVDTVTAGVRVRGTLKQPELTLFSEPAMSESDIASYFLLGRPMDTTEGEEGQQLQKALLAARLAGGELFVDQTGIYSYVDELSFETNNTTEQTSLVVGKYLSPKIYVRYMTGIIESSNIVEVHYKLSKYLRVQTEAGYRGSSSVTGADIYYTIEY